MATAVLLSGQPCVFLLVDPSCARPPSHARLPRPHPPTPHPSLLAEYATVTRSVTIEMLKASPALRLAPANASREPKKAKGGGKKKGKR